MFYYSTSGISIYLIQSFLAVANNSSFTKAADFMHVTQSAISKSISTLETQLGLTLFTRERNHVKLTPAGEHIYKEWSKLDRMIEESIQRAHLIQSGETGTLLLGVHDSFSHLPQLWELINHFSQKLPNVNVRVEYGNLPLIQQLVSGTLDIVIQNLQAPGQFKLDMVKTKNLAKSPLYIVMLSTNPLANKEHITKQELKSLRYIVPANYIAPAYSHMFENLMDFTPEISYFSNSTVSILDNLCRNDEAIIIDRFVKGWNDSKYSFHEIPETESLLNLIWRADDTNPLIPVFLEGVNELSAL